MENTKRCEIKRKFCMVTDDTNTNIAHSLRKAEV